MRCGRSRPWAGTGRGLPPIDSCKRWPTAINPQPTTTPAEDSGTSAVGPDRVGARPCFPIGSGLIALDQSSEPARKTRTGRLPSGPRERPAVRSRIDPPESTGGQRRPWSDAIRRRVARVCPNAAARGFAGGLLLRHQSWAMQRRAPDPTARYRFVAALVWRGGVTPPQGMPHGGTRVGLYPSFGGARRQTCPFASPRLFSSVTTPLSLSYTRTP
jgi:hypothetical protein